MSGVNLSDSGREQVNTYFSQIRNNLEMQTMSLQELGTKNQELNEKKQIQLDQLREIEEKEKLLLTRSRMLQISQDRNAYKKKIIYSLIAVIFAIFIFTLVMYVLFIRKMAK